jgi:mono/diheme cytochrome c family protein
VPPLRTSSTIRPARISTSCGEIRYSDSVTGSVVPVGATVAGLPHAQHASATTAPATASGREGRESIAAGFFRIVPDRMTRLTKSIILAAAALVLVFALAACGEEKLQVAQSNPAHHGAELFKQRCAGCHTLNSAGTRGSASNIRTRERTDGPNFNVRSECVERVLYALENGGFSGAIMPQNIVTGADAQAVAEFVAKYAGRKARTRPAGDGNAANGYRCTNARSSASSGSTTANGGQ